MYLLVVDDDSVVRMTLRTVLTADGHSVQLAAGGEDALAKLEQHNVDLVISDISMPGMDGLQLRDAVRANPKTASLPILFMSGYDDYRTRAAIKNSHLEGFFQKGNPLTELLGWLQYLTTPVDRRSCYPPDVSGKPAQRRDTRTSHTGIPLA